MPDGAPPRRHGAGRVMRDGPVPYRLASRDPLPDRTRMRHRDPHRWWRDRQRPMPGDGFRLARRGCRDRPGRYRWRRQRHRSPHGPRRRRHWPGRRRQGQRRGRQRQGGARYRRALPCRCRHPRRRGNRRRGDRRRRRRWRQPPRCQFRNRQKSQSHGTRLPGGRRRRDQPGHQNDRSGEADMQAQRQRRVPPARPGNPRRIGRARKRRGDDRYRTHVCTIGSTCTELAQQSGAGRLT